MLYACQKHTAAPSVKMTTRPWSSIAPVVKSGCCRSTTRSSVIPCRLPIPVESN